MIPRSYECIGQMSITDLTPADPPCYTCRHALIRGVFRLCGMGRSGYRRKGEWVECEEYRKAEEDD